MASSMKKKRCLQKLRVLELYSGIGGMHFAFEESGIVYEVVEAMDINPAACLIYRHNFPSTKVTEGLIEGALNAKKMSELCVDVIVMSPPCQPFTRTGMKRDVEDARTNSFLYLLNIISSVPEPPQYILLENVKGFEKSQAREALVGTLQQRGYTFQEFLLTPLQFGIPNCRLRYYLLARKSALAFSFHKPFEILWDIPDCAQSFLVHQAQEEFSTPAELCCTMCGRRIDQGKHFQTIPGANEVGDKLKCKSPEVNELSPELKRNFTSVTCGTVERGENCCDKNSSPTEGSTSIGVNYNNSKREYAIDCIDCCSRNFRQKYDDQHKPISGCQKLEKFLEHGPAIYFAPFLLPDKDLKRFIGMDIVHPAVRKITCFTRRYGNYVEGGGSFLHMSDDVTVVKKASQFKAKLSAASNTVGTANLPSYSWSEEDLETVRLLQLRHFTPREIANLLCFPKHFSFPEELTRRQMYKCLGNSLNVHVVSVLLRLLLK